MSQPLLRVEGLRTWFPTRAGLLQRTVGWVRAVDGIELARTEKLDSGLLAERLKSAAAAGTGVAHRSTRYESVERALARSGGAEEVNDAAGQEADLPPEGGPRSAAGRRGRPPG